jgi:signal transduction histidine kinase
MVDMFFRKLKFPVPVVWIVIVLVLTLLPDALHMAGYDFGSLPGSWNTFVYSSLEYASLVTAFLLIIISFVFYRIKGDVSTPIIASVMLFSAVLDMVHIMANEGLILNNNILTFSSIYTWSFSRTFNGLMLLIGAGMFLIRSEKYLDFVKTHHRKFLIYVLSLFTFFTAAVVLILAGIDSGNHEFLLPYLNSRQLDFVPLVLYIIGFTVVFPKLYSKHPSIFLQSLLLSLIPSISAQLHVVIGHALPYDHNTMVASYEKLLSYYIPFVGIAMNYLQTHFSEVRTISRYRMESNQKNEINSLLEGVMDVSFSAILVFESVNDIHGAIRDFRCIKFNLTSSRLLEMELKYGRLYSEIFDDEQMIGEYADLVATGSSFDREVFCNRIQRWLKISSVKYRNGFVMTICDIADSKIAQDQLCKREALLSQAETIAQLGSWEIDLMKDNLIMSDNMMRMFDIDPAANKGKYLTLTDILHPEDRARSRELLKSAIENNTEYFDEFRVVLRDDSIKYFIANGKVVRDNSGHPMKCVGVTMDISSRVMVKSQLRRNEILYRTFASNMPDTEVILFNEQFTVVLAEGNSSNPLFRSKDVILGQDVRMVIGYNDLNIDVDSLLNNAYPQRVVSVEEVGNRFFRVHRVRIDGEEGEAISGMILFQDITEIKKAELQLKARLMDLDRSNKELENFAYAASHDLQEPLRKIAAFGDRLRGKYEEILPPDGIDYIRRMTDATLRMQRLISDLLAFSRITKITEPFAVVDLTSVIKDIISDIDMQISNTGSQIEFDGMTEIEGVHSQMHQLFQNLLLNAIKFSKSGVPPKVKVYAETLSARALGKRGNRKFIRITVKDNGIGFNQKYATRIFTLFQRLHGRHEYEGTGIGLALCKKIVENHHGSIEAFGIENEGAEFVIVLPLSQCKEVKLETSALEV